MTTSRLLSPNEALSRLASLVPTPHAWTEPVECWVCCELGHPLIPERAVLHPITVQGRVTGGRLCLLPPPDVEHAYRRPAPVCGSCGAVEGAQVIGRRAS